MIYTKEPWEIHNGSTSLYIIAKDGNGNHVTVAQVFPRGVAGCETKGNARLIEAAPKMYQALTKANLIIKTFNELLLRHEPDSNIVGVLDGLFDDTVFEEALAEVEGKEGEHGQITNASSL